MTQLPTYSAMDVANAFIEIARRAGKTLTNMQLQKLVYIAYGYYAGFTGEKLFRDEIQAWNYGPVIPNLYHKLKHFGLDAVKEPLSTDRPVAENSVEMKVIEGVWDAYGKFSALNLSNITHKDGTPWSYMWERSQGRKNATIPFEVIQEHYQKLIHDRMNVH